MRLSDFQFLNALVINGRIPYNPETRDFAFYAGACRYVFNEEKVEATWFSNRMVYRLDDKVDDTPYQLFKLILHAAFNAATYNVPQFVLRYDDRHYSVTPSLEGVTDEMVVIATIYPRVF